ncbi:MAG: glycosyltransferase family 1 protein, partial [Desulfamplus sp.]|nr:glycosyltransferase family 1 protein [Desulfamplus sp.]
MKIILATYGSRGDVQPMLALSLALQYAGHEILLVGPPEKREWASSLGCPFHSLGANLTDFIDSMEEVLSLRCAVKFVSMIRSEMLEQFKVLPRIIAGADLVIGASLVFGLASVAEAMKIQYRYIAFTPQLLVSQHHPCFLFKTQHFPLWMNQSSWKMVRWLDRFNMTALLNRERGKIGLKPVQNIWENVLGDHVIVASDREIAAIPPDVELDCLQTGYFHLQHVDSETDDSAVQTQIEHFLNRGAPPVYIGFGSMPLKDQARNVPMMVKAIRSAGLRGVIGKFWDGTTGFEDADDILFIRNYPHLKLFPRMAAVIHHGGAGTTATCAVSGVPQIIVPHILDQYYHAHKVYQAGLGPRPIWRQGLTAQKLVGAVAQCRSFPHRSVDHSSLAESATPGTSPGQFKAQSIVDRFAKWHHRC